MTSVMTIFIESCRPDPRTRRVHGQTLHAEANREAVLAACRRRMASGELRPSAGALAAATDLSVRTVFQHFNQREALLLEALQCPATRAAVLERLLAHEIAVDPQSELAQRVLSACVLGRC